MSQAKAIFLEAIQPPTEDWDSFVRDSAEGDQIVVDEVNSLLQAYCVENDSDSGLLLDQNFHEIIGGGAFVANRQLEGEVLGDYQLIDVLGSGGNGTVYRAQQSSPIERQVAIKFLNVSKNREALERFKFECGVAASMEHPNIARVYNVGFSKRLGPYLVMELIEGNDIVDHCRRHRMAIRQRVELFRSVCQGIRYAHQTGCIHRDIKPNNVLVQTVGEEFIPKIIDFGVAKLDTRKLDQSLTEDGQFVGSLSYAFPEQLKSVRHGVDVRSDIYSLGLILYKLLVGDLPVSQEKLFQVGLAEQIRLLTESKIVPPSDRVQARSDYEDYSMPSSSHWSSALSGELDWIVAKCLEYRKEDRYPQVGDLIKDLDNFLAGMPISVGPPSFSYKASRFVRRNKKQVALSSLVAVVAVMGLAGTLLGWSHAREAKLAKEFQQSQIAETKKFMECFAEEIGDAEHWLLNLYLDAAMSSTIVRWEKRGFDNSESEMTLRTAASEFFLNADQLEKANDQLRLARELSSMYKPDQRRILKFAYMDAVILAKQNDTNGAIDSLKSTLEKQEKAFGEDDDDALRSREMLVGWLIKTEQFDVATEASQKLIDLRTSKYGPFDETTVNAREALLSIYVAKQDTPTIASMAAELLEIREKHLSKFSGKNCRLAWRLHLANMSLGNIDLARMSLEKLCLNSEAIGAPNPHDREKLAEMYAEIGEIKKAIETQEIAIQLFKNNDKRKGVGRVQQALIDAAEAKLAKYVERQTSALPK